MKLNRNEINTKTDQINISYTFLETSSENTRKKYWKKLELNRVV